MPVLQLITEEAQYHNYGVVTLYAKKPMVKRMSNYNCTEKN